MVTKGYKMIILVTKVMQRGLILKKTMINTMTNREKCRERAFSAVLFNVRSIVLILVMMLTTVAAAGLINLNAYAQGRTVEVATYDQLQEALENTQGVSEIVIDPQAASEDGEVTYSVEDDENSEAFYIAFDGPLTVSHDITIKNADDVDVYLARSDSFRRDQGKPALLNVDPTGTLNLEGLITLTGEEVSTTYDEEARSFTFAVKSKDGTGEDNEVWNRGQVLEGGYYIQSNGGKVNLGEDVIVEDFHTTDDVEGVEPILEKDADGRLFASRTPAEEEAVEEETEEATEETAEATEEETTEEKTEEKAEETTPEEAPVIAPKKSLKSMKSPATQMRSTGDVANAVVKNTTELKVALKNGVNPIILDTNLVKDGKYYFAVDEPLTVNKDVEITTKDGKEIIIARSTNFTPDGENNKPAIFNVVSGGELTLSQKVTMSGVEIEKPKYVKLKLSAGENVYFGKVEEGYSYGKLPYFRPVSGANSAMELTVKSTGHLSYNTTDTIAYNFVIHTQDNPGEQDFRVSALDDDNKLIPGYVSSLEEGKTYVASVVVNGVTEYIDSTGKGRTSNLNNALRFTAEVVSGEGEKALKVNAKTGNDAWTKDKVLPGGYFINATNGGKVTINNNVTLKDLKTKADVVDAAPVYIGSGSEFTMNGGDIMGNTIGYAAVDPAVEAKSDKAVVQYSGDPNGGVRQFVRGIDMTNTAGGIIFDGNNAVGKIKGGSIKNNQADVGGILVKNGATVTFGTDKDASITNPSIDNNIGFHHAGAVQVESGGTVTMYSGQLSNNTAWHRGGAVWATAFGTTGYVVDKNDSANKQRTGGNFIMKGGSINNNFAFVRGGGINVESNGVVLEGGKIEYNKCKSLGGGIYVEGDTAAYSYTLVIKKGDIRGNTAVRGENVLLDKKLQNNSLVDSNNGASKYRGYGGGHHNDDDFPNGHSGNGGGVWLCPLGGTSVFATNTTTKAKVVIDGNTASGSGQDFFLTRGRGSALIQNIEGVWKDDNNKEIKQVASGKVLTGPLGMYADGTVAENTGIKIHNNLSRDGGGIAANGTVILGETEHVYRFDAELELEKEWASELANKKEPVTIELKYIYNDQEYILSKSVADETKDYTIIVDSNEASGGEEGDVIFRNGPWKAKALISPVVYHDNDPSKPVELYRILKGDGSNVNSYYDLKTTKGVEDLYKDINNNSDGNKTFKVKWMNLVISETAPGKNKTYNVEEVADPNASVVGVTTDGSGDIKIHFSSITVRQKIKNSLRDTSFTLTKAKLSAPKTKLQGAEFKLYKAELGSAIFVKGSRTSPKNDTDEEIAARAPYKTLTSDANGVITFNNVEPGPYLLFETKVAPGYELPKSPWFIYVDEAGNPTVVRMNDNRQGQLTNDSYHPYDPSDLNNWVQNKWWHKDWFRVTANSNTLGNNSDTNVEISSSVGDGIILIKDGEAANESGVLSNKLFELYKYNEDKKQPLDGVVFIMHGATVNGAKTKLAKGNKVGGDAYRVTSQSDTGMIDISSLVKQGISEKKGTDPSKNIPALAGKRVFLLYEDQAKSGYVKAKMPWLVILDGNGTPETPGTNEILEIREYKDKYSNDTEWDYADFDKVIWAYDGSSNLRSSSTGDQMLTNKKGSLEFIKVKPGGTAITGQSVTFKMYNIQEDKTPGEILTNGTLESTHDLQKKNEVATQSTNPADGKVTFENLNTNKFYFLFEDTEPTGYKKSDNPWLVYLKEDGTYRVWKFTGTGSVNNENKYWSSADFTEQTTDKNKLQNEVKVELTKVGPGGEAFNGTATFELYEVQINTTHDFGEGRKDTYCYQAGYKVGEITTNNGVLDLTSYMKDAIKMTDIATSNPSYNPYPFTKDKYFILKETATSDSRYEVQSAPWLVIVKTDGSVELKVYEDTDAVAGVTRDKKWYHWERAKFKSTTQTQAGKLENNLVAIEITKVNSMDSSKPVVGAKFVLNRVGDGNDYFVAGTRSQDNQRDTSILATDNSLKVEVDGKTTFETNAQGKISFTAPTPGKYFLFEYDVPKGYNLAKSPWLIEVTDDYDVTVKAINPNQYGKYKDKSGKTQSVGDNRDPLLVYNTWWAISWYDNSDSNTTITNEPITIKKVGEDDKALSGAIFSIWTVNYDPTGVGAIQKSQNLNETYGENAFVSDANGNIDISALYNHLTLDDNNDYTRFLLYEESAPEGYKRPKAPWMIIIDETDLYDVTLWANGKPNTDFGSNWIPYNNYCNYTTVIRNTKDPNALYKKDAESLDTLLNGAKFDLYAATKKQNCYWTPGRRSKYICEDILDDGKHIVTRGDLIKGGIESGKDTDKGKINLSDLILPDGYLLLYETDAPDEYIKASTPWILVIEKNKIKDIQKCKIPYQESYVNHDSDTEWKLKDFESTGTSYYVTNYKDYELPKSGGMGTYWFMVIGAMMMGFALTAGFTKMNLLNIFRR